MEWAPAVLLIDVSSDAEHLALPFAEKAQKLVMYDGAELSTAIAASLGDTEALLACKKNRFPSSASAALEADRALKPCFGNNATSKSTLTCSPVACRQIIDLQGGKRAPDGRTAPRERNGIAIRRLGFVLVLANPKAPDF